MTLTKIYLTVKDNMIKKSNHFSLKLNENCAFHKKKKICHQKILVW